MCSISCNPINLESMPALYLESTDFSNIYVNIYLQCVYISLRIYRDEYHKITPLHEQATNHHQTTHKQTQMHKFRTSRNTPKTMQKVVLQHLYRGFGGKPYDIERKSPSGQDEARRCARRESKPGHKHGGLVWCRYTTCADGSRRAREWTRSEKRSGKPSAAGGNTSPACVRCHAVPCPTASKVDMRAT